jgi:hypothetical protein
MCLFVVVVVGLRWGGRNVAVVTDTPALQTSTFFRFLSNTKYSQEIYSDILLPIEVTSVNMRWRKIYHLSGIKKLLNFNIFVPTHNTLLNMLGRDNSKVIICI